MRWLWGSLRALFRIFCRTWLKVTISGTEHLRADSGALLLMIVEFLLIHAIDVTDREEVIRSIRDGLEKKVMEACR